jgi:hypothetical protein
MAMCLSLSSYVILFCLFLPKLRVVLLKPNKNVRSKNNMVKSLYNKSMAGSSDQQLQLQTRPATASTVSKQLHGNPPSFSHQTTEKSVTVGTVASTGSTLSSPSNYFFPYLKSTI